MKLSTFITSVIISSFCASSLLADADTKVQQIEVPVDKCSSPVLSIAINEIDCKAQSCQNTNVPSGGFAALAALASGQGNVKGIGGGVKSMLTNAIKETKCFKIVDLEQFEKMKKMLASTGQEVKPPKIDLIIGGTVSSIDVSKEGGALAGGMIPIVGMFSKNTSKASIGVDFYTMNPSTLEMGESKSFKADSEKSSWGFGGVAGPAGGGWSVTKNVALDNVIRDVVFSATNYLTDTYAKDKIVEKAKPIDKAE
jgi:curli biogenesis system outer membrane secretion channel CsgG